MYPGSLPLIFNGSVPGHEELFNVRRCSMYTGDQFDRFHCTNIRPALKAEWSKALPLTASCLSRTTAWVRITDGACEKVARDLGLCVVFGRVLQFPPPVTTG